MTYVIDTSTPVWGGNNDQGGDPAYYESGSGIANLNFGDLADGYIPTDADKYTDSDWVEWAPGASECRLMLMV